MGKNISKSGDGVNLPKSPAVAKIIGSSTHTINGVPIALDGDIAEYNCPSHHGAKEIATLVSNSIHLADGKPIVTVGDRAIYCKGDDGKVISGSIHSSE